MTYNPKGLFSCGTLDAGGRVMLEPAEYRALGDAIHKALRWEPCFNGKGRPDLASEALDVLAKYRKKTPWRPLTIRGALTVAGERPTLTLNPAYRHFKALAETIAVDYVPEFVSLDDPAAWRDAGEAFDLRHRQADDESRYYWRMDEFGRLEGDPLELLPDNKQGRALRMLADGATQAEVAKRFGVDVRTVRRWSKAAPAIIASEPEKAPAARAAVGPEKPVQPRGNRRAWSAHRTAAAAAAERQNAAQREAARRRAGLAGPGEAYRPPEFIWIRMPENDAARGAIMAPGCYRGKPPASVWRSR